MAKERNKKTLEFEEAERAQPTPADLRRLVHLAQAQMTLEDEVLAMTEALEAKCGELRRVSTELIPSAMEEIGVEQVSLTTGHRLAIKELVKASIPKAREREAFAWLREAGHGGLIKNEVVAKFGRGDDAKADALLRQLEQKKVDCSQKTAVNANTLAAFVKEQLEAGAEVPFDLLGVFIFKESKITRPKTKQP